MNCVVKPCPPPGQGVHLWTFHAYNKLRSFGRTHEEAAAYCHEQATRPLNSGDIPSGPDAGTLALRKVRMEYDEQLLQRLAAKINAFGVDDITAKSPIDPATQTPETVLRHLYLPGEKVLLFDNCKSQGQIMWQIPYEGAPSHERAFDPLLKPSRGKGVWLLANPITGEWVNVPRLVSKHNPEGRTRRAVESLTYFRYCVVESDAAPEALWLRALVQMPLPIVAVTSSGGKSIHALINTGARSLEEWLQAANTIAGIVVPLGADPATLNTPAQLTRMPGFFRAEKNKWQRLLYLNPGADSTPIVSQPKRGEP
jgi:hypothetical protein